MKQDFSELKEKLSANARTLKEKRLVHFHLARLESYQARESFDGTVSTSLHNQPEINAQSRMVLCQWMNEVSMGLVKPPELPFPETYAPNKFCAEKEFLRSTFHRAIVFLDVYLAHEKNFPLDHLQVLGSAAVFSAAKLEEPEALSKHMFLNFGDDEPEVLGELERLLQKFHAAMVMRQVAVKATPYEWVLIYIENLQSCGMAVSARETWVHVSVLDVMVLVAETGQYASSLLAAAALFLHGCIPADAISMATGYELTQSHSAVAHLRGIWEYLNLDLAVPEDDAETELDPVQPQIGISLEDLLEKWDEDF
ncbi:hypothetical protein HDU81_009815 [Chytriomyces hyalinus]|nr:hypothetical protein HDU81_009815 [Chytriomyces hyalinus]